MNRKKKIILSLSRRDRDFLEEKIPATLFDVAGILAIKYFKLLLKYESINVILIKD